MFTDLNKFIQGRISPDNEVPFTLPVALDIMLQIARGLKYIHERGVGHRDIKPSNILMTPTPVPELAEMGYVEENLADFGMAKVKLMSCTTRSQTANVGTPVYRAPELFDGADAKVSHRV
jgi:serine/threonine protein kinase